MTTTRFVVGGLYRTRNNIPILNPPNEYNFIPPENYLVYLTEETTYRVFDKWYWVDKNQVCKIITPTYAVARDYELVVTPST